MLDLTDTSSKPMIVIAKLNIKYLKIRVEEGGKNYGMQLYLLRYYLLIKPDYF